MACKRKVGNQDCELVRAIYYATLEALEEANVRYNMYVNVHPTLKRREYEHERASHAEAKGNITVHTTLKRRACEHDRASHAEAKGYVTVHPTLKRREHECDRASHAEVKGI